jgi:hypothetical protein
VSCDWGYDQARLRTLRCEIAKYATRSHEDPAPACGDRAGWHTDDLIDGETVWMCDYHCRELLSNDETARVHEVEA